MPRVLHALSISFSSFNHAIIFGEIYKLWSSSNLGLLPHSWDSSVVQRWPTSYMIGDPNPGKDWEFFSSPPHPDRFCGPPNLLSNGYYRGYSLGIMRPERESDQSSPFSAEVNNAWSYTFNPQYICIAWCAVKAQGSKTSSSELCSQTPWLHFSLRVRDKFSHLWRTS
jgi:hypothetical protein